MYYSIQYSRIQSAMYGNLMTARKDAPCPAESAKGPGNATARTTAFSLPCLTAAKLKDRIGPKSHSQEAKQKLHARD